MLETHFQITKYLFSDYVAAFLTVLIKKEALDKLEYVFDDRFHIIGDYDLTIRLSLECEFDFVDFPLAFYRWHNNNETSKNEHLHNEELKTWYKEMTRHSIISKFPELDYVKKKFIYHEGINKALNGKKINSITNLLTLPFCIEKFKLLVVIILPKWIIKKIKT